MNIFISTTIIAILIGCTGSGCNAQNNQSKNTITTEALGAMSPQKALEYMKITKNIVIVDVATSREYKQKHFEGAINIHYSEMPERYQEIPQNSRVILHCRLGMVVPNAYRVLLQNRPDITELSYIDGAPLFDEYNSWKKENKNQVAKKDN